MIVAETPSQYAITVRLLPSSLATGRDTSWSLHLAGEATRSNPSLNLTMAHILSAVTGTQVDIVPITRALISVSDKTGIVDLCTHLHSQGVELLSTGGTAKTLRDAGLPCIDVSEYTGSPECLDGRVKTLHPKIHGGSLGVRGNAQHEADMKANDIGLIDMTILNLYPFDATVKAGGDFAQCIENVDIGGPSMLRSTAKNHAFTTIVTSPDQYEEVKTCMLSNNGGTTLALRRKFAARAFALSASYDSTIATWFGKQLAAEEGGVSNSSVVTRVYKPEFALKYGKSSSLPLAYNHCFYLSHCSFIIMLIYHYFTLNNPRL